ncbi:MAG: 16S rRNA processing protein RimM [Paludibacteraceae bacterium]|nr:16S rRNA processing protein RimM [Paludibacteraceae bacterium]
MISTDEILPIGQINKPHGVNGEMSFTFTSDVFDSEEIPYLIMEIDGIPVPFYIEEYRFKTNSTGLIKFQDIDSEEAAREFNGLSIYVLKKYLDKVEDNEIELAYFVGFMLRDAHKGDIGIVTEIDESTDNTLFVIAEGEDEILIPVGDDYITDIDHNNKIILTNLPEGLLDL